MRLMALAVVLGTAACGVDCDDAAFTTHGICVINPTLPESEITEIVDAVGKPMLPGAIEFGPYATAGLITFGGWVGGVHFRAAIDANAPPCLQPYVVAHELLHARCYAKTGTADTDRCNLGWTSVDARKRRTDDWAIFAAVCNRERCGDEWCDRLSMQTDPAYTP